MSGIILIRIAFCNQLPYWVNQNINRCLVDLSIPMVNCPPLLNSKRCLKASAQNCKIEALKLVGEVKANF
ncbi:hypothetical protein DWQ65_06375 [Treponema phagedenis]|nr:hypothetical protein FUT81_05470 [Treponema phagedenis]QSH99692.1 hypothetical protein DWQ65_06375 [Treponema phagedenis]